MRKNEIEPLVYSVSEADGVAGQWYGHMAETCQQADWAGQWYGNEVRP